MEKMMKSGHSEEIGLIAQGKRKSDFLECSSSFLQDVDFS